MANKKEIITTIGIILGASALGFGIYWFGFRKKPMPGLGKNEQPSENSGQIENEIRNDQYSKAFFDMVPEIRRRIESEYPKVKSGFGMAKYSIQDQAKITNQLNKVNSLINDIPAIKKLINMANTQYPGNEVEGLKQIVINYSKGLIVL